MITLADLRKVDQMDLEAENRALREALQPFSDAHFYFSDAGKPDDCRTGIGGITYGDFRRAVSALADSETLAAEPASGDKPMSYRTWYDPPRKGDEEPFPGSPDDMMNTVAAMRALVGEQRLRINGLKKALEEARKPFATSPAIYAPLLAKIDAALAAEPASGEDTLRDRERIAALDRWREHIETQNRALREALRKIADGQPHTDTWETSIARAALAAEPASGEADTACLNAIASNEPCQPDDTLKRCTLCGFIVDTKYKAEFPKP